LQLFLLAFPDTFIIDNNIGGDKQWQGTWRVGRKRPPNRSDFITYNRIGEDHQRQTDEALDVMESILSRGTKDISESDIGSDSHWDQDGGTVDWPRGLPISYQYGTPAVSGDWKWWTSKFAMGSRDPIGQQFASPYDGLGCASERHASLLDCHERACWDSFNMARQILPFDTRDRVWRWTCRLWFHGDTFTGSAS
jgi:hypothetical protein